MDARHQEWLQQYDESVNEKGQVAEKRPFNVQEFEEMEAREEFEHAWRRAPPPLPPSSSSSSAWVQEYQGDEEELYEVLLKNSGNLLTLFFYSGSLWKYFREKSNGKGLGQRF